MTDDPVLAPWRRMKRAGGLLFAACILLLPLYLLAIRHRWLQGRFSEGALLEIPKLLWLGLAGGGLTALLASIKLRRCPPR